MNSKVSNVLNDSRTFPLCWHMSVCVNSNIICALYHDILYSCKSGNVWVSEWMSQVRVLVAELFVTHFIAALLGWIQCNHFLKLYCYNPFVWLSKYFSCSLYNAISRIRCRVLVSIGKIFLLPWFRLAFRSVPNSNSNTHPQTHSQRFRFTHIHAGIVSLWLRSMVYFCCCQCWDVNVWCRCLYVWLYLYTYGNKWFAWVWMCVYSCDERMACVWEPPTQKDRHPYHSRTLWS